MENLWQPKHIIFFTKTNNWSLLKNFKIEKQSFSSSGKLKNKINEVLLNLTTHSKKKNAQGNLKKKRFKHENHFWCIKVLALVERVNQNSDLKFKTKN